MNALKQTWHYLLVEPFSWMFYCFFQPGRFAREFDKEHLLQRIVPMLRLALPMFLLSYPFGFAGQLLLIPLHLSRSSDISKILLSTAGGIAVGIAGGIAGGIAVGIAFGISFIISYLVGLYRIPLYPISGGTFLFHAYIASYKRPPQVFTALRHSALHWDERVYLPLPFLKRTLLIAMQEDMTRTLEEIAFIAAERPQQRRAARAVSLTIAVGDLETRTHLTSIAEATQRLNEIFPPEANLLDPQWVTPFARLRDACQDAARACSPIGRQARINALEDMKANLLKVHPDVAFRDQKLNRRLGNVVKLWLEVARQEQEKLASGPQEIGRIDNPYKPGQVLKLSDTLFVGRRDLAQQLEEALRKGDRRPTLMLNGERRMGKSTTLVQLPRLLGSRYLPIFYDLQNPGIIANTAIFLYALAKEIHKVMNTNGMQVKPLSYDLLKDVLKESDGAVYHEFDGWLSSVEGILEQEDRTLLLAFDEFEKLDEERQGEHLHLPSLLNWLRNVMQYRSRLALLFSGVRTISEMGATTGTNWSSYFVNVQTLRVSFLRPDEARRLITQPVPDYPGDEIFGTGVVDKIIADTGCHPFLVQAVCSALIETLNADQKERAEIQDVEIAVNQVLEAWWDTYFRDLWYRTDEEQRACLVALRALERVELPQIMQQSGLDERAVRRTLQTLLRRDLVLRNGDTYSIAAPIFSQWVERSTYN
ncbi:MAG TPA: hypothetical protein VEL31_08550 [Ktedonobacteraceae bacterium]|nr:hypothetical protein [Ktedonobacteraceae bacterium]